MFQGTNFKTSTRLQDKAEQKRKAEKHWRDVCREVDERDRCRCRACGRLTIASLARVETRREHHHVIPESRGGVSEVWNVMVTCASCHDARHVTRTLLVDGNADKVLFFEQIDLQTRKTIRTWKSAA